jgi:hypothetical protein
MVFLARRIRAATPCGSFPSRHFFLAPAPSLSFPSVAMNNQTHSPRLPLHSTSCKIARSSLPISFLLLFFRALSRLTKIYPLPFQANPNSFGKTPAVGYPLAAALATAREIAPLVQIPRLRSLRAISPLSTQVSQTPSANSFAHTTFQKTPGGGGYLRLPRLPFF